MRIALFAAFLCCAATSAPAATEIRLWHAMSGALGVELDRLVARYNASQKDIRVVSYFQGPYDDPMAREIEVRRGSRSAPHIVQVNDAGTGDMIRSGAARPLWQLMQDARQPIATDYLPVISASVSDADGRLLALPFTAATAVLYYSREAFVRAGLDPAKPPRTWYEMPRFLGALVQAGERCALTTAWPAWVLVENMSAWHNQRFATQPHGEAVARLAFNTRLMVRWVSMLASWQKAGYFTYAGRADEAEARFASGECAMLTSSSAAYGALRRGARFEPAVAQLPYYDDFDEAPHSTLFGGSALWAMAGRSTTEYRAIASFFAFLSSPAVQADWHQRTSDVPLTTAAYELTRRQGFYRAHPGHEIAVRQLLAKPEGPASGTRLEGLRRIRGIIDEELETVWNGSKAPLEALNAAVQRGNLLLQELR